jgi:hypothetical protein
MSTTTFRIRVGSRHIVLFGAVLFGILLAGCHGDELSSTWRGERSITIDGQKEDWKGIDVYNFEEQKIYLGLANDSTSMYVLLITPNRMLAIQAISQGLRVRFHPEREGAVLWVGCAHAAGMMRPDENSPERPDRKAGRDGRGAGFRPSGLAQGDEDDAPTSVDDEGSRGGRGGEPDGDTGGGRGGPSEEMIQRRLAGLPQEIAIFTRTGDDSLRLSSAEAARRGIEERSGYEDGYFVLEMKVPLVKDADRPQAIGLRPDALNPGSKRSIVEVNFNIPKREGGGGPRGGWRRGGGGEGGEHLNQWGGEGSRGGGGFPGGGRDGFGRGGMRRPGNFTNGLDVTIKVALSGGTTPKP